MTDRVALNQTNVFSRVRLITDSTGVPATGVTAGTSGIEMAYHRDGDALVLASDTSPNPINTLASLTAAHSDWGLIHATNGLYRVSFPDAAFAEGSGSVALAVFATGISCVPAEVIIDPLIKFNGQPSAVQPLTTTFPSGIDVHAGDQILVADGTHQTVLITSVAGQVATHEAWPLSNISVTDTVMLLPGSPTQGQGGANCDVATSSRSNHTQANVRTEMDASVAAGVHVTKIAGNDLVDGGSGGQLVGEV
jgi:hypothetical protein